MLNQGTRADLESPEPTWSPAEERQFEADSDTTAAPDTMRIHLSAIGKVPLLTATQ